MIVSTSRPIPRLLLFALAVTLTTLAQDAPDPESRKRQRLKDTAASFWIYDDIDEGYTRAKASGKPLLVSFRCVP